jgi:hypothetical protein
MSQKTRQSATLETQNVRTTFKDRPASRKSPQNGPPLLLTTLIFLAATLKQIINSHVQGTGRTYHDSSDNLASWTQGTALLESLSRERPLFATDIQPSPTQEADGTLEG